MLKGKRGSYRTPLVKLLSIFGMERQKARHSLLQLGSGDSLFFTILEHPLPCGQRRLVDEPYQTPFLRNRKFIPAGKLSFGDSLGGAIILNLTARNKWI